MWFIFQHSLPCGPHTSSIGVAELVSHGIIEALVLILEKVLNCRYDLIICLILLPSQELFFSGYGTENRWCQIRRIWRVINQFKATVMNSSHCKHRLVCMSTVLVLKQDSPHQFSSPELLSQFWFMKEIMQLISGKVEFNACQVSLLWHNSLYSHNMIAAFQMIPRSLHHSYDEKKLIF